MKIRIAICASVGIISMLVLAFALAPRQGLAAGAASQEQGSAWKRWQLTGSHLNAVDAVSATDAWAAGSDGILAHWNGAAWTAYDNTKLGPLVFNSMDMLAGNIAWTTASGGKILRYDGTTWVEEARNNGSISLYDISLTSPSDGWAVGLNAAFAHYNGTDWQMVAPSGVLTTTMYGVDMLSSSLGWAVGGASDVSGILGKIAKWDGTSWQVVYTGNRILYSIDMLDSTHGWAAGQGGTLLRWDGTNWNLTSSPSGAVTVTGVSVVSTTDAWAVGSTNGWTNNVWHWDGTSWTPVSTPNGAPLEDIVMLSASDGWIVGQRGTTYRYSGAAWILSNSHFTTNGFYGLDFLTPNDGWAVGVLNANTPPANGLQHWNGTDWEVFVPPVTQPTLYDVGMVASDAVWAVGTSGYVLKWNGSTWTRDTSPADAHLYAMSMISATNGWAVGSSGRIVHYDGTAWTNYTSNTTTNLWSIDMVNENEGWAGGTLGLMLHYQNGTWTPLSPNPASFTIEGIHMLNANEGWAVGYNGTILHYLNGTWTPQASPVTQNLLNVHMLNLNEGWAVGAAPSGGAGTLLHYLNGTWTFVPNPTGRTLRDIYVFASGEGWTVSESPGAKLYLNLTVITPSPAATNTAASATSTATVMVTAPPSGTSTNTSIVPSATRTSTTTVPTLTATVPPSSTHTATRTSTSVASATPTCGPIFRQVASPYIGTLDDYLEGVSAIGPDDVWAVGYYVGDNGIDHQTLTMHWNGSAWSIVPSPNVGTLLNSLRGVSARAANDVWAVGYYYDENIQVHTLTMHWNGSAWSIVSSPDLGTEPNYLNEVSALASNDVWAVGYAINGKVNKTLTLHWNGSAWSVVPSPNVNGGNNNSLNGVAAIAANDVWAVGHYYDGSSQALQSLALHWDGSAWSIVNTPNAGTKGAVLYSVSARAATDAWAVGYYAQGGSNRTLTLHWNGSAWSVMPSPNVGDYPNELYGVSAVAPDDAWAAGYMYDVTFGPRTLALHWDGSVWSIIQSADPGSLSNKFAGIAATGAGSVWAVGATYNSTGEHTRTLTERIEDSCTTPTATTTPAATATATACTVTFTDVDETNVFYPFIRCLACRGIIGGYDDGTFRPFNDITRGQIAKIVSNAAGFDEDPGPQIYEDVPVGSPFYQWINRLSMRGHIGGYPCGLLEGEPCIEPDNLPYFRPSNSATRGQLAKIVANAAGLTKTPTGVFYTDVPEGHPFYIWIMRLTNEGVMSGYDCGGEGEPCDDENRPYFRPFNNVTRGQASKIVANTFFPGCQTPQRP